MPAPDERTLTKETLKAIASEQAGLALTDAEVDALLEVVKDLQGEAAAAVKFAPRDAEPATTFVLDGWAND